MSDSLGLNPNDIVDVTVSLSPNVPTATSQNIPLIATNDTVIDVASRVRTYTGGSSSLTLIGQQFGLTSAAYLCAQQYYEQTPQAQIIKIGRWADTATPATLLGGALTVAEQLLSVFTAVTAGALAVTAGSGSGTPYSVTGINLSTATSLTQVATMVQTAFTTGSVPLTITWDPTYARFVVETTATGTTSLMNFFTTPGSGTDLAALMNIKTGEGGSIVAGIAAETPAACATILRAIDKTWYALTFSVIYNAVWQSYNATLTTAAHIAVASFIEAASPPSTYLITSNDPNCLLSSSTTDVMAEVAAGAYKRTTVYYSSSNGAVALEMFASFAVVNVAGSNTATIAMFKSLPGVVAENLTEAQATTITSKNGNVYVNYSDGVAIIQNGAMGSGNFFDEIYLTDALAAQVQNSIITQLITQSGTYKIPQTDPGMLVLQTTVSQDLEEFVTNGTIGRNLPWRGAPFGTINTGDILPKGYYIYQPSIASQSTQQRDSRAAPAMQVAINLAGAVQNVSVNISVTR